MSVNIASISGNLTRDPELRGQAGNVLSFGVAVNERRKNPQTEEWEDYPNFVDCVVLGRRAEALANILRKGMKVSVQGHLRQSRWETKEGESRSRLEVIVEEIDFMTARGERGGGGQAPADSPAYQQGQAVAPGVYQPALQPQQPAGDGYGEEIPF